MASQEKEVRSIGRIIRETFLAVYPPDGISNGFETQYSSRFAFKKLREYYLEIKSVNKKENFTSKPYSKDGIIAYSIHPITIIAGFLGIPNRPDFDCKPSLTNLFYNFIGWQHQARPIRKGFGFIIIPFTIALNLIAMPFKALLNVVKLVTEFIPQLSFYLVLDHLVPPLEKFLGYFDDVLAVLILIFMATLLPLMLITAVVGLLALLGNAMTSPIASMIKAREIGINYFNSEWAGNSLAFLSLTLTVSAYVAFFPLAANFIASSVLPYLSLHLPAGLVHSLNAVATIVSPALSIIGNALKIFSIFVMELISGGAFTPLMFASYHASSAVAGIAAVVGLGMCVVGIPLNNCIENFRNNWHKPKKAVVKEEPQTNINHSGSSHSRFPSSIKDRDPSLLLSANSISSQEHDDVPPPPSVTSSAILPNLDSSTVPTEGYTSMTL